MFEGLGMILGDGGLLKIWLRGHSVYSRSSRNDLGTRIDGPATEMRLITRELSRRSLIRKTSNYFPMRAEFG